VLPGWRAAERRAQDEAQAGRKAEQRVRELEQELARLKATMASHGGD